MYGVLLLKTTLQAAFLLRKLIITTYIIIKNPYFYICIIPLIVCIRNSTSFLELLSIFKKPEGFAGLSIQEIKIIQQIIQNCYLKTTKQNQKKNKPQDARWLISSEPQFHKSEVCHTGSSTYHTFCSLMRLYGVSHFPVLHF